MEQQTSKLSPKVLGIIAALCCFIVLSLIYFFTIGKGYISGNGSEASLSGETIDYITDDDYDELAKEGNAHEGEEY